MNIKIALEYGEVVKSILKHEKKLNNRKFSAIKCRKPVNRQVFEHKNEEEEKNIFLPLANVHAMNCSMAK